MSKRFEELLDTLSYEELAQVKQDIDNHGMRTKKALEEKLKKKMREFDKTCSVCLNDLRFYSTSNYTLIFGPDDLKKKASFCGLDCLEYFTNHLKDLKTPKRQPSRHDESSPLMDAE